MKRAGIALMIGGALIITVWYVGLADYVTLEVLQQKSEYFLYMVHNHYFWSVGLFLCLYTIGIFLGLPVVIPFTMLGGYLFGLWYGILYSLLSATIGSIGYFLLVRYTLFGRDTSHTSGHQTKFQSLVTNHGSRYLLILHFITIVPYVVINTVAALADVTLFTFVWTTIFGALPSFFLYSFAGRQLTTIRSWYDIIQPRFLIVLFILIVCTIVSIIYTQKTRPVLRPKE